ncbi:MAG: alkaline phosphatase family protein [Candidatus Entotheonellia bacterium]
MTHLQGTHQPKVLIIGLDGATFDLIKPWVETGQLPTFKHLIQEGTQAHLESTIPPITPPAWTSFMTGLNPGKHGVFNFTEYHPTDHSIRYANASNRKMPTIWKLLSSLGCSVGVFNVPMTYPPEEVHGFCISGLDTPDKDSDFVYPRWLKQEIEHAVGEIYLDPRHLGYMKTDDKRDKILEALVRIENRRTQIAAYLIKKYPVDVMMLVYTATDTVQHFFWNYMDPTHPSYDPSGGEKFRDAILKIYRTIDADMAILLDAIPEECTVMVLSDHGGGPVSGKIIHLNQYLHELGLLAYRNGSVGSPSRLLHRCISGLDGYLRGVLSPHQKAAIARVFPTLREKWESYATALTMIDWEKTQAYCLEFLAFPSEIWINVAGRTPHGTVQSGADYEQVIEFLIESLSNLSDMATGRRLIHKVYRKDEVYQGPYSDHAPDLMFSWWEDTGLESRKSSAGARHPSLRSYADASEELTASWSGTHRLHGILLLQGAPFRTGITLSQAHITDIAPTLLYLLGLPVPTEMDGRVMFEAFQEEFIALQPVRYQEGGLRMYASQPSETVYSRRETEKIQERLKDLGYID